MLNLRFFHDIGVDFVTLEQNVTILLTVFWDVVQMSAVSSKNDDLPKCHNFSFF